MAVPTKLVGAWRRSGLILDGVRHVDHSDVIWLQTPEWCIDIRLRIDPTSSLPATSAARPVAPWFYKEFSFAGTTSWEDPFVTFTHLIDTEPPVKDSQPLTWVDGVVHESGKTEIDGVEHNFTEEWLRMTDDDVAWSAEHGDNWARIEVGRFAAEIRDDRPTGSLISTRYHLAEGDWVEFGSVRT